MNASSLISYSIPTLKTSVSGTEALMLMNDHQVQHLPIVNNEQLLGIISEDDILNNDESESIGSFQLSLQHAFVREYDHVFDVMAQMSKSRLSVIPVVCRDNKFLGVVTQQELILFFADSFSFSELGGILVLEMNKTDYSLSEISRVIEAENVTILSAFITQAGDQKIFVHLKMNKPEIYRVSNALERFGYEIHSTYTEQPDIDAFKDRFESFMHYLNF